MYMLKFKLPGIRLFVFALVFLGCFTAGKGQLPQNTLGTVTISSPTAASLGKFGDIPVSYHTGVPSVEIPFYTVQAGPLKLPVSLAYHASGIKVMEPASWVGTGWALNAGGVITRSVQGQPDEAGTSSGAQLDGHFSNYGYNSYFYTSSFGGTIQDWQGFANGIKDGEPDLFFFNFGGYAGKFYFRDDQTPVIVPEQDLQIIPSYSGGRSIDYFTIVTPDGARYTFGNSPNVTVGVAPIETTNVYSMKNGAVSTPPTSSWFLNQVVSADNQFKINLNYVAENYGYYTLSMFPVDGAATGLAGMYGFDLVKDIMQGVRLNQITFPNGTVTFNAGAVRTDLCDGNAVISESANTSATSLGSIQINEGTGFCKKYTFNYSYFQGDNTALPAALTAGYSFSTDETRLCLNSVAESSCDGTVPVPPYKFTYYNTYFPRRLSFGVDHWGYFNGQTSNTGLIPTIYVNASPIQGAVRDPAWPQMLAGELTRVDYPTGGYNTFDFESNSGSVTEITPTSNNLGTFLFGNLDGQAGTYSGSNTFTSNGNNPTLTITTNCNYGGNFQIVNSGGGLVYDIIFNNTTGTPGGATIQTSETLGTALVPLLPAGTYTVTASLSNSGATPTGGVVISLMQPTFDTTTSNVILGGLRIKTITAYDGLTSNSTVTNYSYTTPGGSSTAVLYSVPTYAMQIRNDIIENTGFWTTNGFQQNPLDPYGCPSTGDYIKSPGSIRPMATVQGGIIGYQMVTVSQPGNGSSVYTYYTANNGYSGFVNTGVVNSVTTGNCATSIPNFPPAPLPFDSKRGQLQIEQHYDNSGNLLKDIYYAPVFNESPTLSTPAFIVQSHNINAENILLGTMYSLNTVKLVSMTTMQDDYGSSGGYVTTAKTTYYGSAFHNQPTRTVVTTSKGDSLVTNMQYASDFRLPTCDAIPDCSAGYTSACASCQSTYNTASAACAGSSTCITTAYLAFMQCNTTARTSYVTCRNAYSSSFATCHSGQESTADVLLKPLLLLQDEYANPQIETNNWRGTEFLHANFNQYGSSISPTGYAYPVNTQTVDLQTPSTSFTPAAVSSSTISKDSRYQNETVFTFENGNPWQVTPHSGVTVSYLWDYLNTEPIAKVSNATVDQIAYTSFEADGSGSWTIPSSGRDTGGITGGSCYNLSNGSITRAGLTSANSYVLSFWARTTSSVSITGGSGAIVGKTIDGWTYHEYALTGATMATVSGSGDIDELRLYPSGAQMDTYTYAPLVGLTSQCDVANRVTYYEYDALARLADVKDQDLNVVKRYCYNYNGQTEDCALPYYPVAVIATNNSTVTTYVNLTNTVTQQTYSFEAAAGISAVQIGKVIPGTYTVSINQQPFNSSSFISYTIGTNTQTNCFQVSFSHIAIEATPLNIVMNHVASVVVNAADGTNQDVTMSFAGTLGTYPFYALPGNNGVAGYIPVGTYTVTITPASTSNIYPINYTVNGSTVMKWQADTIPDVNGNSAVTVSANAPASIPVLVENTTNQTITSSFTNSFGGTINFNTAPGAYGTAGYVPQVVYTVTMSPPTQTALTYPIIFTANGNTQTFPGLVTYYSMSLPGSANLVAAPVPTVAVNSADGTTESFTETFTNTWGGHFYFGANPGNNGVSGYIPQGGYSLGITPGSPSITYPIQWNYNGNITYNYNTVNYTGLSITGAVSVSASIPPSISVVASNSGSKAITIWLVDANSGETYGNYTSASGTSNVTLATVPSGQYQVFVSPPTGNTTTFVYTVNGTSLSSTGREEFGGTYTGTITINIAP
jgi:hypothetical protein